jgi:hypothetical protein
MLFALPSYEFPYIVMNRCLYHIKYGYGTSAIASCRPPMPQNSVGDTKYHERSSVNRPLVSWEMKYSTTYNGKDEDTILKLIFAGGPGFTRTSHWSSKQL